MQVEVTARHSEVTDAQKAYAREKSERLSRYFEGTQKVEVVLNQTGQQAVVDVIVTAVRAHRLVQQCAHEDLYAAIDAAVDRMERQLRRHKEKLKAHRGHPDERPAPRTRTEEEALPTYEDVVDEG